MSPRTESIAKRWYGQTVIVAAPGPSLTRDVADALVGRNIVAVQDAYKQIQHAQILYGCDVKWWKFNRGARDFKGEKWSSQGSNHHNNKLQIADQFNLRLIAGRIGNTFSTDPSYINYGSNPHGNSSGNSGFQAVNLAVLFGANRIVLVGFDMRIVDGKHHFFGNHPQQLGNPRKYTAFINSFEYASKSLPDGLQIVNATPGSALTCFPQVKLDEALSW